MIARASLVLRLAGPLQSWGSSSRHNRRTTNGEPTKSGVVGLLAAAEGRRRTDPIADLAELELAVRVDQPGRLRRDYHTVSRFDGAPLPSASVNSRGQQQPTAPRKHTHVTERYYLEEALFVAAVRGEHELVSTLADAVQSPAFPLALGRRSCAPCYPLLVAGPDHGLWPGSLLEVMRSVPWQSSPQARTQLRRAGRLQSTIALPVTLDDPAGTGVREDLPVSFHPEGRRYSSRRVREEWVELPSGEPGRPGAEHDPFALLGA